MISQEIQGRQRTHTACLIRIPPVIPTEALERRLRRWTLPWHVRAFRPRSQTTSVCIRWEGFVHARKMPRLRRSAEDAWTLVVERSDRNAPSLRAVMGQMMIVKDPASHTRWTATLDRWKVGTSTTRTWVDAWRCFLPFTVDQAISGGQHALCCMNQLFHAIEGSNRCI